MQHEAIVRDLLLTTAEADATEAIAVGSTAWFTWLRDATRFRLVAPQGLITVRKERSGGGRGNCYWRAYRKRGGRLYRFYLGPDTALTPKALSAVCAALGPLPATATAQPPPHSAVPNPARDGSGAERLPPILATKITPPALRPQLVARPALVAQLRAAATRPLTLVVAPAGFGKTTLLAQSFAKSNHLSVAWLSLEPSDDAPSDFLVALCAALARVAPAVAEPTGALLRSPYRVEPVQALNQLLSDLAHSNDSFGIVLDDYHVVQDRAVHQLVARLIEHSPRTVHLVIASRAEPPLPLARLRARGLVAELRGPELRFREGAATELLRAVSRVPLSDADATALAARTEGWAVGLHFAALALRDAADPARVIAAFGGAHRLVADYLLSEVLADLPAKERQFLHETAILDRLCAPLCAAVWSDGTHAAGVEAQQLLETLEQRGLFLTPLDDTRTWYRYHPLFAELVRAEFARVERPAVVAALHIRAADWYLAEVPVEGRPALEAAISHTLAGGAAARAAALVERAGLQAVFCGEADTLQRWLKALPPAAVQARPFLRLAAAGHFPQLRHPQCVAEELASAEDALLSMGGSELAGAPHEATMRAEALAVRAFVAQACGNLELAATLLLDALALVPENEHALRWRLLVSLGNAYALEGWFEAARLALTASLVQAGDEPILAYLSQIYCAWVDLSMGRIRRAQAAFRALCTRAEMAGWAELPLMGEALFGLGAALAEHGQLGEGLALLERGLALIRRMSFSAMLVPGELERARICRILGRVSEAQAALVAAAELARDFAVPFLHSRIAAARLDLKLEPPGDMPPIGGMVCYADVPWRLAWARAAIHDGRAGQALGVLAPLLEVAERRQWGWVVSSARVLWALACAVEQDDVGMLWGLGRSVAQGELEGGLLAFLEEGQEALALLRRVVASERLADSNSRDTAVRLLGVLVAAFDRMQPRDGKAADGNLVPESLTPREQEVLLLMAAGATNAEIAAQLVVTVGTVKAHSRSLFGKLGVTNRTAAAACAHRLGLVREANDGLFHNRV